MRTLFLLVFVLSFFRSVDVYASYVCTAMLMRISPDAPSDPGVYKAKIQREIVGVGTFAQHRAQSSGVFILRSMGIEIWVTAADAGQRDGSHAIFQVYDRRGKKSLLNNSSGFEGPFLEQTLRGDGVDWTSIGPYEIQFTTRWVLEVEEDIDQNDELRDLI